MQRKIYYFQYFPNNNQKNPKNTNFTDGKVNTQSAGKCFVFRLCWVVAHCNGTNAIKRQKRPRFMMMATKAIEYIQDDTSCGTSCCRNMINCATNPLPAAFVCPAFLSRTRSFFLPLAPFLAYYSYVSEADVLSIPNQPPNTMIIAIVVRLLSK